MFVLLLVLTLALLLAAASALVVGVAHARSGRRLEQQLHTTAVAEPIAARFGLGSGPRESPARAA
jgi:hypothetical protein